MADPLKWREQSAVADMHCRLAAKKLNALMTKESRDVQGQMVELGKAIECIEAAHDAAMTAYNDFATLHRRQQQVKGVRLTSIRQPMEPYRATLGDAMGKS